jgi:hypothetical protein
MTSINFLRAWLRAVFLLSLLILVYDSSAQSRFSGTFDRTPFRDVVNQIETSTPYRFYFEDPWIDSVKVTGEFLNIPVPAMMKKVLAASRIQCYVDSFKIILTNNVPIIEGIDFSSAGAGAQKNYSFLREFVPTAEASAVEQKIYEIGKKESVVKSGLVALSGYVRDRKTNEPIPSAYVYVENPQKGITTNVYGFYTIYLPPGPYLLKVQFTGMKTERRSILLHSPGQLDIGMEEDIISLKEVTVESERETNVTSVQMGSAVLDLKSMKNVPKVLGENDILKLAITMPGVKNMGEGSSGISVRGGNMDQNLMTVSDAPIYNPNHFLGFFSIFNADALKSSELYKSGFPAQYGGRLSSILDLQMKDGNKNNWGAQGGISPVTAQLMVEIPIVKEKTSAIVGGRSTYSDWILNSLSIKNLKNSNASFYDYFAKVSHQFSEKDALYFTFYGSKDKFRLTSDTLFSYGNQALSLQWRHQFNAGLQSLVSLTNSQYNYNIEYNRSPESAFNLGFDLKESSFKWDLNLYRDRHKVDFGVQSKLYELHPGDLTPLGAGSTVISQSVQAQHGLENAAYIADNFDVTPRFSVYAGLRYSWFTFLGPNNVSYYTAGAPKDELTLAGTNSYSSGQAVVTYHGPEIRLSARYTLPKESSIKISYNRTRQYIHMLSNTVAVSPTNTWTLSDPNIRPQIADQVSAGYYKNIPGNNLEVSMEIYYKEMQNVLDYKIGSELILNQHIEQDVLQGKGRAYGFEFLLKKKTGKVNGWIGYSYSRTLLQMQSLYKDETINNGQWFPANYDRPHTFNVVFNYRITRRYSVSSNFTYNTGRPITYPVGIYKLGVNYEINYSDRNAFRIPDYIRLDVGFNIEGNHKIKKLAHGFWTVSIYNVLGRHNPYSIYFTSKDGVISGYQLSIFGAPIPTITYNFKF